MRTPGQKSNPKDLRHGGEETRGGKQKPTTLRDARNREPGEKEKRGKGKGGGGN